MNEKPLTYYQGEEGVVYFTYQNRFAAKRAALKARRIEKYIKETDRVLDFGCGGGWLLASLNCAVRVGIEPNRAAHEVCRENKIPVYEHPSLVDESNFDVIISSHCLEHVPSPVGSLRSLSDLLKPGGKLIIIVPIDDWRAQRKISKKETDHHLQTWTPRLLANTLQGSGYEVRSIRVMTRQWFPKWNVFVGKVPGFLFNLLCIIWGCLYKQREIVAVADKPETETGSPLLDAKNEAAREKR